MISEESTRDKDEKEREEAIRKEVAFWLESLKKENAMMRKMISSFRELERKFFGTVEEEDIPGWDQDEGENDLPD